MAVTGAAGGAGTGSHPLAGVRVVDLTRLLPGPYATRLLVDLGAEVIKVEDTGAGDYARESNPVWFAWLNAGKRALRLDLKKPEGREVFLRLCANADAVIEGFRPGVMARLGLDLPVLHGVNPRLVTVALTGYGASGPYRDRAGHDLNYLAASGLLSLFPPGPEGAPVNPPLQIADTAGGLMAAFRLVSAVLGARATGRGAMVEAPMRETLTSLGGYLLAQAQAEGRLRREDLPLGGRLACYRCYRTADGGAVSLGALEPKFWVAFCTAAGRPDLAGRQFDPDQEAVAAAVAAMVAGRTGAEWAAFAQAYPDACLEPVAQPEAVPPPPVSGPVPAPGADSRQILAELGYGRDEVAALARAGVIQAQP